MIYAGVGALALMAGIYFAGLRQTDGSGSGNPSASAVAAVTGSALKDFEGRPRTLADYRGKILVINYWATWCAPCREEIPLFVRLQRDYAAKNVQFIGIAIDQVDKVRVFAEEYRINYPLLIGGLDAVELSRKTGNTAGVLPYTLLVGSDGRSAVSLVGSLSEARMRGQLDLMQ